MGGCCGNYIVNRIKAAIWCMAQYHGTTSHCTARSGNGVGRFFFLVGTYPTLRKKKMEELVFPEINVR